MFFGAGIRLQNKVIVKEHGWHAFVAKINRTDSDQEERFLRDFKGLVEWGQGRVAGKEELKKKKNLKKIWNFSPWLSPKGTHLYVNNNFPMVYKGWVR